MKIFSFRKSWMLLMVLGLFFQSCEFFPQFPRPGRPGDDDMGPEAQKNIVELALDDPNLSILADAVVRAGLDDLLSSPGNFTVFAPENAAFEALLASNDDWASLEDIPLEVLTLVLKTHVLPKEFFAADLRTDYFKTLAPGAEKRLTDIFINTNDGVVINGEVNVITPDVDASNGVVHVVDKVINPSSLVALAAANPDFSILVQALTRPDLDVDFIGALSAAGPLTVVAPTNKAFLDLLDSNPDWNELGDLPKDLLTNVLLYHVTADGNLTFFDLIRRPTVNTLLSGATWTSRLRARKGGPRLQIIAGSNKATVIKANVQAQNGVIHGIDTVILP